MPWFWSKQNDDEYDTESDYEDDEDEDDYTGSGDDDDDDDDDKGKETIGETIISNETADAAAAEGATEEVTNSSKEKKVNNNSLDADSYHYPTALGNGTSPTASSSRRHPLDASTTLSQAESHDESTILDDAFSSSSDQDDESASSSNSSDNAPDEDIASGRIPGAVTLPKQLHDNDAHAVTAGSLSNIVTPIKQEHKLRRRVDSAVSSLHDDDDDKSTSSSNDDLNIDLEERLLAAETIERNEPPDDNDDQSADNEDDDDKNGMDQTSLTEKRSLLLLAAEHDRVDILQAILGASDAATSSNLLNPLDGVPPLHLAVSYGSVNATNCLLRMGANPSIRPNNLSENKGNAATLGKNMQRFDGLSAWEVVFGVTTNVKNGSNSETHGKLNDADKMSTTSSARRRNKNVPIVSLAPSKQEGVRHAFTAEALRCIGSDEIHRLEQLLQSGMPPSIDIGGKSLCDWSVTMEAVKCETLLTQQQLLESDDAQQQQLEKANNEEAVSNGHTTSNTQQQKYYEPRILDRDQEHDSLAQLANRLDELDSLGQALSISLDGLAEEVSVCNGLLLMGGGASALAAHVRSLKDGKERKMAELMRLQEAYENSQDELAYWVQQGGPDAVKVSQTMTLPPPIQSRRNLIRSIAKDDEVAERKQMKAQVAASDHKICKLRASITDLSEVLARELAEVEKRGLDGGITLVRGLREEIREIEFALSEVSNAEATCRTKINLIQSIISSAAVSPKSKEQGASSSDNSRGPDSNSFSQQDGTSHAEPTFADAPTSSNSDNAASSLPESQAIASGHSTALTIRHEGHQGLFPFSLWEIIKRIIGFIDEPRRATSQPILVV
ncbi:hypothetical protein MPSEU_000580500 [Mayamaea pseudoterrestris]|nr:hypothetical protein MPSEU_000580500 [Mayamaea pseudoterrestris]